MSRRVVSISLDDETWNISRDVPNLSHFVRTKLHEMKVEQTMLPVSHHNGWRDAFNICWPWTPGGYCSLCWPHGQPTKLEWRTWTQSRVSRPLTPPPRREPDTRDRSISWAYQPVASEDVKKPGLLTRLKSWLI